LHKGWSSRAKRSKYQDFTEALTAAAEKSGNIMRRILFAMCEYSFREVSHGQVNHFSPVLDPEKEMDYLKKHGAKNYKKRS